MENVEKVIQDVVAVALSAMAKETVSGYELPRGRVVPFVRAIAEGIVHISEEDVSEESSEFGIGPFFDVN